MYYFFTRCNRKDKAGNKTDRSAGAGFWKVTCGDRPILDSHKRPIGLKRRLVFIHSRNKLNERVKNKSRNWIMQEYRLPSEKVTKALFYCSTIIFTKRVLVIYLIALLSLLRKL